MQTTDEPVRTVNAREEAEADAAEREVETNLELQQWLNNPIARLTFEELIKDVPLSNLNEQDVEFIQDAFELQRQLIEQNPAAFASAISFIKFVAYTRCNVTLGRKGFGRRMIGTIRREEKLETSDTTRRGWFNRSGGSNPNSRGGM